MRKVILVSLAIITLLCGVFVISKTKIQLPYITGTKTDSAVTKSPSNLQDNNPWITYKDEKHGFSIQTPGYFTSQTNMDSENETNYYVNMVSTKIPKASIYVQYGHGPHISGEDRKTLITTVEQSMTYYDSKFEIDGYPAVKLKQTTADQTTLKDKGVAIYVNILKNDELWSIEARVDSLKNKDRALMETIISTFKFTAI